MEQMVMLRIWASPRSEPSRVESSRSGTRARWLAEQTPSHAASSSSGTARRMPNLCPRLEDGGRGQPAARLQTRGLQPCSALPARLERKRSSKPITRQHTDTQAGPATGRIALSAAVDSTPGACSLRGTWRTWAALLATSGGATVRQSGWPSHSMPGGIDAAHSCVSGAVACTLPRKPGVPQ